CWQFRGEESVGTARQCAQFRGIGALPVPWQPSLDSATNRLAAGKLPCKRGSYSFCALAIGRQPDVYRAKKKRPAPKRGAENSASSEERGRRRGGNYGKAITKASKVARTRQAKASSWSRIFRSALASICRIRSAETPNSFAKSCKVALPTVPSEFSSSQRA